MHFTILNGILLSTNWTSFLYKVVITICIGLACVVILGKIVKFLNNFISFFSKDKDKGLF